VVRPVLRIFLLQRFPTHVGLELSYLSAARVDLARHTVLFQLYIPRHFVPS
jgi:hypothetical protein